MKITNVILTKNPNPGSPEYFATVELDNILIIKGFRLIQGKDGRLFVRSPSQRDNKNKLNSEGRPISYPTILYVKGSDGNLTKESLELRDTINKALLTAAKKK